MTTRLDVMLKTTEQNQIVCTSKFEVEVTNKVIIKKLRSRYCTIEAMKPTIDRYGMHDHDYSLM